MMATRFAMSTFYLLSSGGTCGPRQAHLHANRQVSQESGGFIGPM